MDGATGSSAVRVLAALVDVEVEGASALLALMAKPKRSKLIVDCTTDTWIEYYTVGVVSG